jgi:hypothetical protein
MEPMIELLVQKTGDLKQILLVIDALDECTDSYLVHKLVVLYKESKGRTRVLITSRLESKIESSFAGLPQFSISKDDVSTDIERYVQAQVEKKIGDKSNWLRDPEKLNPKIIGKIVEKADGM